MKGWRQEWLWWLLFLLAAFALVLGYGFTSPRFGLAILLALAPVLPGFALLWWLDRAPPTEARFWVRAVGWGLLVVPLIASNSHVIVAVWIEGFLARNGPFNPEEGAVFGGLAGSILSAPIVEETLKSLLPLWFLCRRPALSGPWPALLVGGLSALGFGVMENAIKLVSSDGGMGEVFGSRSLFPYLHFLFSLPCLLAIGFSVFVPTLSRRLALVLTGWTVSLAFHGLWNWEVILGQSDFSVFASILHTATVAPFLLVAAIFAVFVMEKRSLERSGLAFSPLRNFPQRSDAEAIRLAREVRFSRCLEGECDPEFVSLQTLASSTTKST